MPALDQFGEAMSASIAWTSEDPALATVVDGVVTGVATTRPL